MQSPSNLTSMTSSEFTSLTLPCFSFNVYDRGVTSEREARFPNDRNADSDVEVLLAEKRCHLESFFS